MLLGVWHSRKWLQHVVTAVGDSCRLTGSADLFDEAFKQGLPGGLAAGRRPAYGLNGASYFGKVTPVICVSAGAVCVSVLALKA